MNVSCTNLASDVLSIEKKKQNSAKCLKNWKNLTAIRKISKKNVGQNNGYFVCRESLRTDSAHVRNYFVIGGDANAYV